MSCWHTNKSSKLKQGGEGSGNIWRVQTLEFRISLGGGGGLRKFGTVPKICSFFFWMLPWDRLWSSLISGGQVHRKYFHFKWITQTINNEQSLFILRVRTAQAKSETDPSWNCIYLFKYSFFIPSILWCMNLFYEVVFETLYFTVHLSCYWLHLQCSRSC